MGGERHFTIVPADEHEARLVARLAAHPIVKITGVNGSLERIHERHGDAHDLAIARDFFLFWFCGHNLLLSPSSSDVLVVLSRPPSFVCVALVASDPTHC